MQFIQSQKIFSNNLKGALWMIASMAAFTLEDALIKQLSKELPLSEVLIIFGFSGVIIFALLLKHHNLPFINPNASLVIIGVRALFELIGRIFYFLAIVMTSLSSATIILQATPIIVVIGAYFYFREKISPTRWLAVSLGLLGVIVVVNPSADDFSLASVFAVIGIIGFAGRDLLSRATAGSLHEFQLGVYGYVVIMISGLLYSFFDVRLFSVPSLNASFLISLVIPIGLFAYLSLTKAMRTGDVGAVTPFRYTRLIFGVGIAAIFFKEQITVQVLIGCLIIIMSGLMIAWSARSRPSNITK